MYRNILAKLDKINGWEYYRTYIRNGDLEVCGNGEVRIAGWGAVPLGPWRRWRVSVRAESIRGILREHMISAAMEARASS